MGLWLILQTLRNCATRTTTTKLGIFTTVTIKYNEGCTFRDREINRTGSSSLIANKSNYFSKFKDQTCVRNWFIGFNISSDLLCYGLSSMTVLGILSFPFFFHV